MRELIERLEEGKGSVKMLFNDRKKAGSWFLDNVLKMGQKVRVWTGRGKDDYSDAQVTGVKLWPKPGDTAFIRDNSTGRANRKDVYMVKYLSDPVYKGEPTTGELIVNGVRSGESATVVIGKGKDAVFKLGFL